MNAEEIRRDFPIFGLREQPFVYLDNGATSQKPRRVIERLARYYAQENANIHRGGYPLARQAEEMYSQARETIARWIGAEGPDEIIFTRGCTESVNLAAEALFQGRIGLGDNVIVTELEHSSNYFPWKARCEAHGVQLRAARARPDGSLDAEEIFRLMDRKTRLIAVTAMSNVTGFRPDIRRIAGTAHENGALMLADGAQEIAHHPVSVKELGCDFFCFSGHKVYGPMGVGVLYGRREILRELPPVLYGGGMITEGGSGAFCCREAPEKFEAGTQDIAGALGLEAAVDYLREKGERELFLRERELAVYLRKRLGEVQGLHIIGAERDCPTAAFFMDGFGSYDIGVMLAGKGIAIRCGAHCAYPFMRRLGKESLCRITLSFYNTKEEIDYTADCLQAIGRRRR